MRRPRNSVRVRFKVGFVGSCWHAKGQLPHVRVNGFLEQTFAVLTLANFYVAQLSFACAIHDAHIQPSRHFNDCTVANRSWAIGKHRLTRCKNDKYERGQSSEHNTRESARSAGWDARAAHRLSRLARSAVRERADCAGSGPYAPCRAREWSAVRLVNPPFAADWPTGIPDWQAFRA